jgi:ABC-2 type transport system ATP-binding protein
LERSATFSFGEKIFLVGIGLKPIFGGFLYPIFFILSKTANTMLVKVSNLTKTYGTQNAVDNISFEVARGEILGFLGPNGAGKTTTMKIITGFVPASAGDVEVCGFSVKDNELEVKRKIGYLPEHNPLYKDMYVREYLQMVGNLYKIKDTNKRVEQMIERVGLGVERHKPIGALSKGYRQRVGLAQAMLHDPEVLILDEPTTGLDPNQLVEIRALIKELGQEKTVIFSSHIMQEVEALCNRVIIIKRGKLVADDQIANLRQRTQKGAVLKVQFKQTVSADLLKKIPTVERVESSLAEKNSFLLYGNSQQDLRETVFNWAVHQKLTLLELSQQQADIADVFQELTNV